MDIFDTPKTGYDFYIGVYGGDSINPEDWDGLARRAEAKLRQYKRLYTVTAPDENAESMAVCAMAESMARFKKIAEDKVVSSVSVGSVSESYAVKAVDISPKAQDAECLRCARLYLDFYRGVC